MAVKQYFWNVLLVLDLFLNVVVFKGYPGETVSSHAMRKKDKSKAWNLLYKILDRIQYKHCEHAEMAVMNEDYIPQELRK